MKSKENKKRAEGTFCPFCSFFYRPMNFAAVRLNSAEAGAAGFRGRGGRGAGEEEAGARACGNGGVEVEVEVEVEEAARGGGNGAGAVGRDGEAEARDACRMGEGEAADSACGSWAEVAAAREVRAEAAACSAGLRRRLARWFPEAAVLRFPHALAGSTP